MSTRVSLTICSGSYVHWSNVRDFDGNIISKVIGEYRAVEENDVPSVGPILDYVLDRRGYPRELCEFLGECLHDSDSDREEFIRLAERRIAALEAERRAA